MDDDSSATKYTLTRVVTSVSRLQTFERTKKSNNLNGVQKEELCLSLRLKC
jgi:hypothetical protein